MAGNIPLPMSRLRRANCSGPGITRRRRGRGFEYLDELGGRVEDPEVLQRIRELVIPPAWSDVWICPYPTGHIQAIGTDVAGRRQYRYHDKWRQRRDQEKFDEMLAFARALPHVRKVAAKHVKLSGMPRERVLACAVRLLDRGFFRIGGEDYAEQNQTYGLATMQKRHVTVGEGGLITFDYEAKGGKQQVQSLVDPDVCEVISELKRRRSGRELLAYKPNGRWVDVRSADINSYIKEVTGADFSAKDFRTWSATVLAAVGLAVSGSGRRHADGPQARGHESNQGGLALPRQHARGLPGLVHRPSRLRPVRGRGHDRRRPRSPGRREPVRGALDTGRDRGGRSRSARGGRLGRDRERRLAVELASKPQAGGRRARRPRLTSRT